MKNILPRIVGQAIRAENDARRLARRRQDARMTAGIQRAAVRAIRKAGQQ